jgi:hypothetical protein
VSRPGMTVRSPATKAKDSTEAGRVTNRSEAHETKTGFCTGVPRYERRTRAEIRRRTPSAGARSWTACADLTDAFTHDLQMEIRRRRVRVDLVAPSDRACG